MGWIKRSHECVKPLLISPIFSGYGPGSIWQCDNCGTYWRVGRLHAGGYKWTRVESVTVNGVEEFREVPDPPSVEVVTRARPRS